MRRVARDRIVILTWDPEHAGFWLVQDYFPEIPVIDRPTFPRLDEIEQVVGPSEVRAVPIPSDCSDGFLGAYWQRPASYLDDGARRAISSFSKLNDIEPALKRLRSDLSDGTWERRYGSLRALAELDIGYRLIVAERD
jgi:hypothetical protein